MRLSIIVLVITTESALTEELRVGEGALDVIEVGGGKVEVGVCFNVFVEYSDGESEVVYGGQNIGEATDVLETVQSNLT